MKKLIYAYSAGRSDFDRYYIILKELNLLNNVNLKIIASNVHYSKKFGETIKEIKKKKFSIINRNAYKSYDYEKSFKIEVSFLVNLFKRRKPDIIIVLGDRYEMLAAAATAIGFNIPIIHIFGGAVTVGATDELNRHAITKMSHFHLVAHEKYARRLFQLGEEKWRVKVIGIPELKYLKKLPTHDNKYLYKIIKLNLDKPTLLVNFHPITNDLNNTKKYLNNLLLSLSRFNFQIIFTYPNADKKNNETINKIKKFINLKKKYKKKYIFIKNAGDVIYKNLLEKCKIIIGNSSSGIVEAASFKLPSINIGDRQEGKIIPLNVINSSYKAKDITNAIKKAQNKYFLKKLKYMKNPYEKKINPKSIALYISQLKINKKLIKKNFINIKI